MGLGNWREANGELEQISPRMRGHLDVLRVRADICIAAKDWDLLKWVATAIVKQLHTTEVFPYMLVARAYAEVGRFGKARVFMEGVAKMFPDDAEVHYALAVYACNNREPKRAMEALKKAGDLSKTGIRARALEDPRLEKLWMEIGEI